MARALGVRARFVIAYLVLGAAVGAGLGAFIVLLQRPGPKPPTPWSAWKPTSATIGATAQQIASHIGASYKLEDGRQLARIVLSAPPSASANVEAIVLANGSSVQGLYDPGKTILYTLCGRSRDCALKGHATVERGDALRRETLELALYTLKYAKVADVAVFFPPDQGDKTSTNVFFFPRKDFARQLSSPLKVTLPHERPPTRGRIDPRELRTIDELTGGRRFHFAVVRNQNRRLLVLQPAA